MSTKQNKDLKEQIKELEEFVKELNINNNTNPSISIELKHYVLEYWHLNKENFEEIGKWTQNALIKSRDTYQIMSPVYAFQFYDLINICINGEEYLEGTKKHNLSPIIYVGTREYINDKTSIIIDKDGDYHNGNNGITLEEYLIEHKISNNILKRKK